MDEPPQRRCRRAGIAATATTLCDQERDMLQRTPRSDVYAIAASAILAIGGMFVVRSGEVAGWWLLLACSLTAGLIILKPIVPTVDRENDGEALDISPWGVRRYDATGLHEAVSWADLSEVAVVTTPEDEDAEDVYLVLRGRSSNGLIVPHTLAVESGILSELHLRLSDFDSQGFIDALASTAEKMFVLWRAPTPVSPLHAGSRSNTPVKLRAAS
jgi:hypothetical protein